MDYAVTTARREGKEEGREEGRKEGIAIGEERGVLKTARQMKQKGIALDLIQECTGLSDEEIENL